MVSIQSSEMRNLSAIKLRPPLPKRMFVTFPFNNLAEVRNHLPDEAHLVSARGYGTCSAMDQSLILGTSAIVRHDDVTSECPRTALGSMLVTNQDSVNCVREHGVVTCI